MLVTPMYNGQGLGNQLATYVTTRVIALDNGYSFGVMYPERFKGSSFMNLDFGGNVLGGLVKTEGETPEQLPLGIERYYREKTILHQNGSNVSSYDDDLMKIPDNTMIHGLMQGEKYFKHRLEEVREWLRVEPIDMPDDLCVINFRGGEYKWVKDFFLPQSYWDNAINYMKKANPKVRFEVHTDDAQTAKEFFPDFKIVQDISTNWRSIRYARYLILSNSSFAILPAILNTNLACVIAPKYFARFNISDGYWSLDQNYVAGWNYLDREGKLSVTK